MHAVLEQDRVYQSVFPLKSATHGGDDVPIFVSGPMSHLFNGVHEQTFIAHGMAYAACIGWDKSHCRTHPRWRIGKLRKQRKHRKHRRRDSSERSSSSEE